MKPKAHDSSFANGNKSTFTNKGKYIESSAYSVFVRDVNNFENKLQSIQIISGDVTISFSDDDLERATRGSVSKRCCRDTTFFESVRIGSDCLGRRGSVEHFEVTPIRNGNYAVGLWFK